jgi:hypothetical protein
MAGRKKKPADPEEPAGSDDGQQRIRSSSRASRA